MSQHNPTRLRWRSRVAVFVGVFAAAFVASSVSGAEDPIEKLRLALTIILPTDEDKTKRTEKIREAIKELTQKSSISQLRRAYFLKEWSHHIQPDKKPNLEIENARKDIGKLLAKSIRAAALDSETDLERLAIIILVAEIADAEQPIERSQARPRFARDVTDVLIRLVKEKKSLSIRQGALHALGRITPDPAAAIPVIADTLQNDELGPRQNAAYALTDLVRNAHHLPRDEELDTIEKVIHTAGSRLSVGDKPGDPDESIRGYCLQAMQESAKAILDYVASSEKPLFVELKDKKTLLPGLQKILTAFQATNPQLLTSLHDSKIKVRLTALHTLEQVNQARGKLLQKLKESATGKRTKREELLKDFAMPDPLGPIIERDWQQVADLLQDDDPRLRRGAINFLEQLKDQAQPAVEKITQALRDRDRFVRWGAARTIQQLPAKNIGPDAMAALGELLLDPDSDLGAAAAAAVEEHGAAIRAFAGDVAKENARAALIKSLGVVIGNGDPNQKQLANRSWDAETRLAAMKALAAIGGEPAQEAIPATLRALPDGDVRVRREAAYTIGRLGRPISADLVQQVEQALGNALRDDDPEVRLNTAEAITSISPRRKGR